MAKVKFIATTLTSKGRFGKGDVSNDFTESEAKELQRLSSVESPAPTVKKVVEKAPEKVAKKATKKKVVKDESKDLS